MQKTKSVLKERIFTVKDEELFSFATKLSDGATVENYETLGGIESTARHLVMKGGRLTGVPVNGPFVGLRRRKREKKSPFCALAALREGVQSWDHNVTSLKVKASPLFSLFEYLLRRVQGDTSCQREVLNRIVNDHRLWSNDLP